MRPARPWILLLACSAWPLAHAQPIFRCGDSYSQQPCPGGTQVLPAGPRPSPDDRTQAAVTAARDARLADSLEKDRLRREAQAVTAPVVLPATPLMDAPARQAADDAGPRRPDVFTAKVPGSRKTKAKAAVAAKAGAKKAKAAASAAKSRSVGPAPVKTARAAGT